MYAARTATELDRELAPKNFVTDAVDQAQAVGDIGADQARAVIGMDLRDARDRLADTVRQTAHGPDAPLGKLVDGLLHARDQHDLHRIQRHRRDPQERVLHEDKAEIDEQHAALEGRQGKRVADEAADGFHLRRDHGNNLAGRNPLEMGKREPHHPGEQLETQAPQHALAQPPAEDIDVVFEPAVEEYEAQKGEAQGQQERNLLEREPGYLAREVLPADGLVDDDLGEFESGVEDRKRNDGYQQYEDLLRLAVPPNKLEDGRFHRPPPLVICPRATPTAPGLAARTLPRRLGAVNPVARPAHIAGFEALAGPGSVP